MVVNLAGNSSNQGDKMKQVILFLFSLFFIFNCCGNVKVEIPEVSNNEQIEAIEKLKDEKEDGKWNTYYENGQIFGKGYYKEGYEDGKWTYYKEDGSFRKVEEWKDGELIEK